MRNYDATRCEEICWYSESSRSQIGAEVVSKIGAVGQIKNLDQQRQRGPFFDPEVLGNPSVELEKRLSSQIVERNNGTLTRSQAISVAGRGGSKRVESSQEIARAGVEDDRMGSSSAATCANHIERAVARSIRTGGLQLQDRSNLETSGQIDHTTH